jgi:hypothetical protein
MYDSVGCTVNTTAAAILRAVMIHYCLCHYYKLTSLQGLFSAALVHTMSKITPLSTVLTWPLVLSSTIVTDTHFTLVIVMKITIHYRCKRKLADVKAMSLQTPCTSHDMLPVLLHLPCKHLSQTPQRQYRLHISCEVLHSASTAFLQNDGTN